MTKQQLKELLKDMSLQEKVNQMLQVAGNFYMDDTVITGPMKESGFTEENISQAGSVLGVLGASKIKEIQKSYMENTLTRFRFSSCWISSTVFALYFPFP